MIKVAIIGYGYMGQIRHQVVAANPELELTLICEPDTQKLSDQTKDGQKYKVVRDSKQVLESDAELVFVCTPNNLIPELTIECLKRGKHVFAEKPPGRSLKDILAIREQEQKSPQSKLMFGFNHRFHPGIQRAKSLIHSKRFGEILWVRGLYGKSGGKNYKNSWRNDKKISGGGILLDQGIHMLDLFCYFCGDFEEVKAFASGNYWNVGVEDNAFVLLKNQKNQFATLHSSATFWKHRFQIEFGLEKGYVTVQGLLSKTGSYGRETLILGRQQFEDEADALGNPSEEVTYFDRDLSWELEVQNIVKCIKENLPVKDCSSQDAVTVMRIIDKAYKDGAIEKI